MRLAHNSLEIVCLATLIVGVAIGSIYTALSATHRGVSEQAWRRTTMGWEHASTWQHRTHIEPAKPESSLRSPLVGLDNRWDTHPAALALCQLFAVLMILKFVPGHVRAASRAWRRVPEAIVRSYRASFFGS